MRESPEPIDRLICEAVGVTGAALAVAFAPSPEPVPLVDAARTVGVHEPEDDGDPWPVTSDIHT
jgi:hypothetical protein